MIQVEELEAILDRFKNRTATEADQRLLKTAADSGAIRVKAGSRGVAIGGNADRATIITGDGNVILNLSGPDVAFLNQALSDSRLSMNRQRDIPPNLPYLCNRIDQENELYRALEEHQQGDQSNRPFIAVIHGDEADCTDAFLLRLRDSYLPKIFSQHLETHFIQWPRPSKDNPNPVASAVQCLETSVRRTFEEIKDRSAPLVIAVHISTSWCDPFGKQLIEAYFSFWNEHPGIGRLLINFLCITYVHGEWWNILKRRGLRKLNREIKASFECLESRVNIGKVLLSQLPAIDEEQAKGWARLHEVRLFWNADIELLIEHVRRPYRSRFFFSQRLIPMQVLAPQLRDILLTQDQ